MDSDCSCRHGLRVSDGRLLSEELIHPFSDENCSDRSHIAIGIVPKPLMMPLDFQSSVLSLQCRPTAYFLGPMQGTFKHSDPLIHRSAFSVIGIHVDTHLLLRSVQYQTAPWQRNQGFNEVRTPVFWSYGMHSSQPTYQV